MAPAALVAGDFTGSGTLDLAAVDNSSNDVTVLLGRGDGTFQALAPYPVDAYPFGLVAGDFNSDGRLDLATANELGQAISVGLGLGNGQLTSPQTGFPPIRSAPIVADFTGDGIADVVSLRKDGKILFRPGQPGGSMFGAPEILNADPALDAREIHLITNDGRNYLGAVNARTNALAFYTWVGSRFQWFPMLLPPGVIPGCYQAADLNGDGLLDGVLTPVGSGQVLVYLQKPADGSNPLINATPDYRIDMGFGISNLALADLDGDGRLDLIATNQVTGQVAVALNMAMNPLATVLHFRTGSGLTSLGSYNGSLPLQSADVPVAVAAGLFDGGTLPDLAILNSGAHRVQLLHNDGQGGLFNPSSAQSFPTGLDPVALVTADFNGDGHPDLAILNRGSDDLTILLGDGHGGFTEKLSPNLSGQLARVSAGNDPTSLTVIDLDNDRFTDDLLVGDAEGDVLVLRGNGDGTFQPFQRIDQRVALAVDPQQPGVFAFANQSLDRVLLKGGAASQTWQQGRQNGVLGPSAVQFADLTGDGQEDLIVANGAGNNVLVYLAQGDGRFRSPLSFPVGTDPLSVTVADLTGNGIPDLVVANEGSNDLSLLYGQGRGADWTLVPGPRLRVGAGPVATVVQNVSGTGYPDILVANSEANNVYLLPGVGRGFFDDRHPLIFPTGTDPVQLFVGHFATTSSLDLVTVDAGSSDLTYFPGFGPGRSISLGEGIPVAALGGDFSHDGLSDLIVASRQGIITLLQGSAIGPQALRVLTTGLVNLSDLALGSSAGAQVEFYATIEGREEAIPLTLTLDLLLPSDQAAELGQRVESSEASLYNMIRTPVVVFSSPAGAPQEILSTLFLGSGTPTEDLAAAAQSESNAEPEEANESAGVAELQDQSGDQERNALITGTAGLPLQQFLNRPLDEVPSVQVPFASPLGAFDSKEQSVPSAEPEDGGECDPAGECRVLSTQDSVLSTSLARNAYDGQGNSLVHVTPSDVLPAREPLPQLLWRLSRDCLHYLAVGLAYLFFVPERPTGPLPRPMTLPEGNPHGSSQY